ncbi:MAG TPA: DbpA RNA binding domain-containing protein, partial [Gemmatimonadaceae bacterium]|nr:DbpA RNA binding domain-containing protein [Gemmatimonadaceae bacterium]
GREGRPGRGPRAPGGGRTGGRRPGRGDADVTRLYIGLGRKNGVRPADLVGAIANEAGLEARAIGAIEIADRFSLVEVPDAAVESIIGALRNTTIRGKRPSVRLDREPE